MYASKKQIVGHWCLVVEFPIGVLDGISIGHLAEQVGVPLASHSFIRLDIVFKWRENGAHYVIVIECSRVLWIEQAHHVGLKLFFFILRLSIFVVDKELVKVAETHAKLICTAGTCCHQVLPDLALFRMAIVS